MTVAPSGPDVLHPGHPVQLPRILVRHLPGGRREDVRRRPAPGLPPDRPAPGPAPHPHGRRHHRRRHARAADLAQRRPTGSRPSTTGRTPCGCAATGSACGSPPPRTPSPRSAAPTSTVDPVDGVARVHLLRDRPPLPGHGARPARCGGPTARRRSAPPTGSWTCPRRPALGDRDRGVRHRPPPVRRDPSPSTSVPRPDAPSSPRSSTRSRPGAARRPRPPSWPPTCCGRPPSPRPASSPGRPC